ncbi:putative ABC transporter ATP-binding protein YbhF [Symmachiella macrocystis]|uniref:Putative ABC transporter ATP-binding protein YbhF n=1 Tax=Symmachiella macrocystis TaxID=2527985 RepID=A0A5C6BNG5_9PLAN|nr:ABC transporter ATP-binding protein [Symmachiella macrocystis]TWU13287.1 putative ABC transporter ATP-binding protein YbhF [Symmachiella macrocystis]
MQSPLNDETDCVVDIRNLVRQFGHVKALDGVSLQVPRGAVYGIVGVNGAGKTTLLKHVLGLLKPQRGTVTILGRDPVRDPVGVLARLGYLSEQHEMPDWMRIGELLAYTGSFYPTWSNAYVTELVQSFQLSRDAKVQTLSKGQRARVGLVLALAHRPEILVLDEPSSGLDPIVRRDILAAIIRTISEEGRTVIFSSHLLDEVERVADHIAMLHQGRLLYSGTFDEMRAKFRRVTVRFQGPQDVPPVLPDAIGWAGGGYEWTAIYRGQGDELQAAATMAGGEIVEEKQLSLDEIFVAHAGSEPPLATIREAT